ncbi:Cysteine--tRNA ligase [subsurface metagenome]
MKVYNTLSGRKEEFLPQGDEVKMYVCGVTPYADCHIGHGMSYIIFDVIWRYLQFRGYKVKYVQNITDIDDKIIDRANQLGISIGELAGKFTTRYFEDMDALNISRADIYPKATEEIPKIIEVIQGLVDKGYAYPAGGSVYFRVKNVPDYGKLSHRSLESMMSAENALGSDDKESPMDFVLWKAAKPGEPSWESPWGAGRPGWHIECSVMSLKYLGNTLDIHGGGQDLVFPHHENEIAQSESFTGIKPFVKYWLHNGLVQLGEEKMSKSLGNLITIREALEKYSPDAIRIFVLSSHYRSPLTYSEEALAAAERGADRLRQAVHSGSKGEKVGDRIDSEPYRQRFIEAMDDDFNTAQALGVLFDLARDINRVSDKGYSVVRGQQVLLELANVLGLTLEPPEKPSLDAEPFIELLLSTREQLRQASQFQLADEIRAKLGELGITLEDTPQGTVRRIKR